jgi:hypothetical protein
MCVCVHIHTHRHLFITVISFLTDYSLATCNHFVTHDTVSYIEMLLNKLLVKVTWDKRIATYVVGSKSFWPDIQKPCQMENSVRDI